MCVIYLLCINYIFYNLFFVCSFVAIVHICVGSSQSSSPGSEITSRTSLCSSCHHAAYDITQA